LKKKIKEEVSRLNPENLFKRVSKKAKRLSHKIMPTPIKKPSPEEDLINLDEVSKEAKSIIDKVIKDVGRAPASRQLAIGCASGWMTGYLFMKVGKSAAMAVGGGIILLQIANHNGYVKVNWDRLSKKADEVGDKLETAATSKGSKFMDKVRRLAEENTYLAASFIGGFFIGISVS